MDLIELGFCRKPHGVKGAFSFHLYNRENSILTKNFKVTLRPLGPESSLPKMGKVFEIASISFGNKIIATLKGVEDRNSVESMLPFSILVERKDFPETEEGEIYLSDLIGCKAYEENGDLVGEVVDLGFNGVQDILVIKGKDKKIEILFIDTFVLDVDMKNNRLVVRLPEYI